MGVVHELLAEIREHPELLADLRRELQDLDDEGTAEQMATRYRCHPKTLERWCREGRVPGAHKVGRTWMVPRGAVVLPKAPTQLGEGQRRSRSTLLPGDKDGQRAIADLSRSARTRRPRTAA